MSPLMDDRESSAMGMTCWIGESDVEAEIAGRRAEGKGCAMLMGNRK